MDVLDSLRLVPVLCELLYFLLVTSPRETRELSELAPTLPHLTSHSFQEEREPKMDTQHAPPPRILALALEYHRVPCRQRAMYK